MVSKPKPWDTCPHCGCFEFHQHRAYNECLSAKCKYLWCRCGGGIKWNFGCHDPKSELGPETGECRRCERKFHCVSHRFCD